MEKKAQLGEHDLQRAGDTKHLHLLNGLGYGCLQCALNRQYLKRIQENQIQSVARKLQAQLVIFAESLLRKETKRLLEDSFRQFDSSPRALKKTSLSIYLDAFLTVPGYISDPRKCISQEQGRQHQRWISDNMYYVCIQEFGKGGGGSGSVVSYSPSV